MLAYTEGLKVDTTKTPITLTRHEALQLVRDCKRMITPRFATASKVYMYGSYVKGDANPWSDIDVAVIVPKIEGDWLTLSAELCHDMRKVSVLIEPMLMEQDEPSPLYRDVMRTGGGGVNLINVENQRAGGKGGRNLCDLASFSPFTGLLGTYHYIV